MKRILVFSTAYLPQIGGAEIAVKEITDRIAPADFEFEMVTMRFEESSSAFEKIGNISVHRVGALFFPVAARKLFFPFSAFFRALSLHRKNKYDLIWSIMANRAGFAALFFKFCNARVPFVLTLQEGDSENYPLKRMGILRPVLAPFWKTIFKKADVVTTISNYLADWGKRMGAKNVEVIPNGVEAERFKIDDYGLKLKEEELRKRFGFSSDAFVLITTSRLVPKNAVGNIIEAIQLLPANVKLLIAGAGPLEADLKLQVTPVAEQGLATGQVSFKLQNRIQFVGEVPQKDLLSYLAVSDIFIRPSLSEGLGISFLEAMAAGLPIIGTNVGGIPDFLKDGETGLFVNVNDPKDIAEKVKILMDDENLRRKIAENGQKLVSEKFNWDGIAERMKKVFMLQ